MQRKYDGRFYKSIGGYLYLVFCNGRWRFPGDGGGALGIDSRKQMAVIFAEMKAQGITPKRVGPPEALNKAVIKHGNCFKAWKSLPWIQLDV